MDSPADPVTWPASRVLTVVTAFSQLHVLAQLDLSQNIFWPHPSTSIGRIFETEPRQQICAHWDEDSCLSFCNARRSRLDGLLSGTFSPNRCIACLERCVSLASMLWSVSR